MAATAANAKILSVSTTLGGTYYELAGIDSADLKVIIDTLEVSAYKDGIDKEYISGLRDKTIACSGSLDRADTNGQSVVRTAVYSTPVPTLFWKYLPVGGATNGVQFAGIISSYGEDGANGARNGVTFDIQGSGAITVL